MLNWLTSYKEYKNAKKAYKKYLSSLNNSTRPTSHFIDLDYSLQKKLQPLKDVVTTIKKYRVDFYNQIFVQQERLVFQETKSFLDPNLFLFNNSEKEYQNYLRTTKERENLRNQMVYQILKGSLILEEYKSDLKLQKIVFTNFDFKKYKKNLRLPKSYAFHQVLFLEMEYKTKNEKTITKDELI